MEAGKTLSQRVEDLERELQALKDRLDAPDARSAKPPLVRAPGVSPPPLSAPATPPARGVQLWGIALPDAFGSFGRRTGPPRNDTDLEASILGAWFARVGAVAVLLGAAFAFKYAIDRGLIGPAGRVGIGVLAGIAFIAWGEWAHRRGWPLFAQAVSGGGIALIYLSIWASFQLYHLAGQSVTLALLIVTVAGGAALALIHNSVALAILSTVGGFLNPIVVSTGAPSVVSYYTYLALLDLGVLGLAFRRRWRALDSVALAGTWISYAVGFPSAAPGVRFGFATIFFVLFTLVSVGPLTRRKSRAQGGEVLLLTGNATAFFAGGMATLDAGYSEYQGIFLLGLGALHLGLSLIYRRREVVDRDLVLVLMWVAAILFTLAVPVQLDGEWVGLAWAVLGVVFVLAGPRSEIGELRLIGGIVLALSLVASVVREFDSGVSYRPERLLVSTESLVLAAQIAALYAAARLFGSKDEYGHPGAATAAGVTANLLTLVWLSFEAQAYFVLRPEIFDRQAFMFSITAIWGLYAGALLAVGVAIRSRSARVLSMVIFGVVILKMGLADLWLLPTGFRILAFLGLGALLLASSLAFHRFQEFIMGDEAGGPAAGDSEPARP